MEPPNSDGSGIDTPPQQPASDAEQQQRQQSLSFALSDYLSLLQSTGDPDAVDRGLLLLLLGFANRQQRTAPRGTPQDVVDSLPRRWVDRATTAAAAARETCDGANSSADADAGSGCAEAGSSGLVLSDPSCPCCLEEHETVVQFPCGHFACEPCAVRWLSGHDTCVMCRASVVADGGGADGGGASAAQQGVDTAPPLSSDVFEDLLRQLLGPRISDLPPWPDAVPEQQQQTQQQQQQQQQQQAQAQGDAELQQLQRQLRRQQQWMDDDGMWSSSMGENGSGGNARGGGGGGLGQDPGEAAPEDVRLASGARRRLESMRGSLQRMQSVLSQHAQQQRQLEGQIEQLHEQRRRLQDEYGSLRVHGDRIAAQLRTLSERAGGGSFSPGPSERQQHSEEGGADAALSDERAHLHGGAGGEEEGRAGARLALSDRQQQQRGAGGASGSGGDGDGRTPARGTVLTPLRLARSGGAPLGSAGGGAAARCVSSGQRPPTPDRRRSGPRAAPGVPGQQQLQDSQNHDNHHHQQPPPGSSPPTSSPLSLPPVTWRSRFRSCDGHTPLAAASSQLDHSGTPRAFAASVAGASASTPNSADGAGGAGGGGGSPLRVMLRRVSYSPRYYASARRSLDGHTSGSGTPLGSSSPLPASSPVPVPHAAMAAVWPLSAAGGQRPQTPPPLQLGQAQQVPPPPAPRPEQQQQQELQERVAISDAGISEEDRYSQPPLGAAAREGAQPAQEAGTQPRPLQLQAAPLPVSARQPPEPQVLRPEEQQQLGEPPPQEPQRQSEEQEQEQQQSEQQQEQQQSEEQQQEQPARRFAGLDALRRHNALLGRETELLEAEARLSRAEARLLRAQEAVLQRQAQLLRHQVAQLTASRQQPQQQQPLQDHQQQG